MHCVRDRVSWPSSSQSTKLQLGLPFEPARPGTTKANGAQNLVGCVFWVELGGRHSCSLGSCRCSRRRRHVHKAHVAVVPFVEVANNQRMSRPHHILSLVAAARRRTATKSPLVALSTARSAGPRPASTWGGTTCFCAPAKEKRHPSNICFSCHSPWCQPAPCGCSLQLHRIPCAISSSYFTPIPTHGALSAR